MISGIRNYSPKYDQITGNPESVEALLLPQRWHPTTVGCHVVFPSARHILPLIGFSKQQANLKLMIEFLNFID